MLVFLIALDANYERARSSSTSSSTFGGLFYSEGYTDQDGWTRRHYLDKLGFTQLLWKTLQELRFHNPPEYYWRKEDTCHK